MRIWSQIALGLEAIPHWRRRKIQLSHGRQSEHKLNRLHHPSLVVTSRIDDLPAGIWADRQGHGAVTIDVIKTILRVVFDYEDAGRRPELALRDSFDDSTECEVV